MNVLRHTDGIEFVFSTIGWPKVPYDDRKNNNLNIDGVLFYWLIRRMGRGASSDTGGPMGIRIIILNE